MEQRTGQSSAPEKVGLIDALVRTIGELMDNEDMGFEAAKAFAIKQFEQLHPGLTSDPAYDATSFDSLLSNAIKKAGLEKQD